MKNKNSIYLPIWASFGCKIPKNITVQYSVLRWSFGKINALKMDEKNEDILHLDTNLSEETGFCCSSTFHLHSRVFNKMDITNMLRHAQLACRWAVLLTSVDKYYIRESLQFRCDLADIIPFSWCRGYQQNKILEYLYRKE